MNMASATRLGAEVRAVVAVWRRESTLVLRERTLLLPGPLPTLLILAILGLGLGAATPHGDPDTSYAAFLLPGVLVMATQPPALATGARILRDRQSDHLDQMLMAPVRRESVLLGKALAGTTTATCHGTVLVALATTAGLPWDPSLLAPLMAVLVLASFATTCLAALLALCLSTPRAFRAATGLLLGPLVLLSGTFFPLGVLPPWLAALCAFNPLTHAVDAARHTLTAHESPPPALWASGSGPSFQEELAVLVCFGALCLLLAARRLSRPGPQRCPRTSRPRRPPP